MRTMLDVSIPVEAGNVALKEGRLQKTILATVDQLRPEASYFYPENGQRHAFFGAELKESSQIPGVVERLFEELNAAVTITPVMNYEDLKKGLGQIGVK
ncbi:MAG: hypothetical protein HY906_09440 [Deltaproteobacteria bacterium]|nr:hypothetical protein [Deltaproteobacteria bacterium]